MENSKPLLFGELVKQVQQCKRCHRMEYRKKVLGPLNGDLKSQVVFVAEAPGRLGADKFGIPLYGDQTGRNFEALMASAGLCRESVFITNAVLCNPRTLDGRNDSPKAVEILNCSHYLSETLDIIKPIFIVPMGKIALASLNYIEPHEIRLSEDVGKIFKWKGHSVFPLYHPGPRSFVWRKKAQQEEDFHTISYQLAILCSEA